jgi:GntR family galactonate operon transcriptional repressor
LRYVADIKTLDTGMKAQVLGDNSSSTGQNLANKVAETLAKAIFSGTYQPGDMLPRETELVTVMSVSRASIGSGLLMLTALGIIKRQAGVGTVVEQYEQWNLLDPLVNQWMVDYADPSSIYLRDIVEYRYAIEPTVSAIAATHATAADLAEIEKAYNAMSKSVESDNRHDFSQADIEFHAAIYRATHNLIWAQSANILKPSIHLVIQKSSSTAEELGDSLQRHYQIMECIRLRKPTEAFDAAVYVLDRTAQDLNIKNSLDEDELLKLVKAKT